jgi:hypothetical protein
MIEKGILIWGLCMFMDGQLIEHTYQKSMSECMKSKRIAMRTIGNAGETERVYFSCGQLTADIEHIDGIGSTQERIRILKIHKHDYKKAYK